MSVIVASKIPSFGARKGGMTENRKPPLCNMFCPGHANDMRSVSGLGIREKLDILWEVGE